MPLLIDGVLGTAWGTWRRKVVSVCTLITAIGGAIVMIKAEASDLEYMTPASVAYAKVAAESAARKATDALKDHENADKRGATKLERIMRHIQLEQAQGKSEAVENDLFKAGLELKKATDESTKEYIQQQVIKLQATKNKINGQIETLSRIREDD